jgi:hypothetical protein
MTPADRIEFLDGDAFRDEALVDRYFLRDILWCEACDLPLRPALVNGRLRYYTCGNVGCRRPALPAETMEQQVWRRFVLLNELFATGSHATAGTPHCGRCSAGSSSARARLT